jgi:hypothetical protein
MNNEPTMTLAANTVLYINGKNHQINDIRCAESTFRFGARVALSPAEAETASLARAEKFGHGYNPVYVFELCSAISNPPTPWKAGVPVEPGTVARYVSEDGAETIIRITPTRWHGVKVEYLAGHFAR